MPVQARQFWNEAIKAAAANVMAKKKVERFINYVVEYDGNMPDRKPGASHRLTKRNDPQIASRSFIFIEKSFSNLLISPNLYSFSQSNDRPWLFFLQRDAWILGGSSVAACCDDQSRDQQHSDKRQGEHPEVNRHSVGEP